MIKRYPIVSSPISLLEIFKNDDAILEETFKNKIKAESIYFLNSATSSLYLVLETLKEFSDKDEVIVPAYSASSIIFAIKKARLKPKLCDISLEDFNFDENHFFNLISPKTLCAVLVYLFGIVSLRIFDFKKSNLNFYIIEDCAQAFGSKIDDRFVGTYFDFGIFSFNRGKNTPTYGGGAISVNDRNLSLSIKKNISKILLEKESNLESLIKIIILYLSTNPYLYGFFYPIIFKFKQNSYNKNFKIASYNTFKKKLLLYFLKNLEKLSKIRYENAKFLLENLKQNQSIILPQIHKNSYPAFNRFPIVFKDLKALSRVEKVLNNFGFETSRMYNEPLHWTFDLGYKRQDFPNANFLSSNLLTVPIHPNLKKKDLEMMVDLIKNNLD